MTEATVRALTRDEARAITDEVKNDTRALWRKMAALYEGDAHKALGYDSWGAYCSTEFSMASSHAYRLLDAGRIAEMLDSPTGEPPAVESVVRELAPLRAEPEAVREAWDAAVQMHGKPTAAQVREVVRSAPQPVAVAPEPPGDDTRFSAIENAHQLIRLLPPVARIRWPVEPGDVDALDEAMAGLKAWLPKADAAWRQHKRNLRATRAVPAAMGNGTRR